MGPSKTRRHRFMMRGVIFKRDVMSNLWVVGIWNEVPEDAVEAGTIIMPKRHLDRYMVRNSLGRYGANAGS